MQFVLATALFVSFVTVVFGEDDSWKQKIEYFETVTLDCAKFNNGGTIHSVQAWIFPSGEIREPQTPVNDTHIYTNDNGFLLNIDRLDDPDFGIYYCIVDKGVNSTGVIKIGVNVDGAYYGSAFLDGLTDGTKVGGIAAGCTIVVLVLLWVVCKHFSHKRSKFNHERREALHLHDIEDAGKSADDSVYYIADGMAAENGPEKQQQQQQQPSPEVKRADRLSSSTSDHYHSIGTLEKVRSKDDGSYDNTAF